MSYSKYTYTEYDPVIDSLYKHRHFVIIIIIIIINVKIDIAFMCNCLCCLQKYKIKSVLIQHYAPWFF